VKLRNAKDRDLSTGPLRMPNLAGAFRGYTRRMTAKVLIKGTSNFESSEEETYDNTDVDFRGCLMPFKPRQLSMKPEGQRSWKWSWLFASYPLELAPDDVLLISGLKYRVMAKSEWQEGGGFSQYELVQDYADE